MDVYKTYATETAKEQNGVWQAVGGDARLLIARSGNRAYARLLSKLVEQNQRALDAKTEAAEELSTSIMIDVMAQTILLGWDGAMQFKGVDLPYSVENAKTLLGVKDFRALVIGHANDFDAYRVAQEADAKKS